LARFFNIFNDRGRTYFSIADRLASIDRRLYGSDVDLLGRGFCFSLFGFFGFSNEKRGIKFLLDFFQNMKIKKITQTLILLSLVAIFFDLVRLGLHRAGNPWYLIWNLFLAWIPYIISICFIKKDTTLNRFIPFFIFWLLFFPNAPYLATDVFHLVSSPPALLWYDSLLFFFFGWIGLFLGLLSLWQIQQYFKMHFRILFSELSIFAICFISSFGIYLGRFERWNSWDIFLNPIGLAKHSFNLSANFIHLDTPFLFVLVFTVFMYLAYRAIYVLIENQEAL